MPTTTLCPADLGLPTKFRAFHPVQIEALDYVLESNQRFIGLNLQTGSGKSLLAAAVIKAIGGRGVVLTATKGLQQSYLDSFASIGLTDARGKANFRCSGVIHNTSCRFGALEGCTRKNLCDYMQARYEFCSSDLGITNYAYWIHSNKQAPLNLTAAEGGPNPPSVLVLDEAHDAYSQLAGALQIVIKESAFRELGIKSFPISEEIEAWSGWAGDLAPKLALKLEAAKKLVSKPPEPSRLPQYREQLARVEAGLELVEKLASLNSEQWICEQFTNDSGRYWNVDCVWPGAYAERYLFQGIQKVLLLSATLRPLHLKLLGIDSDNEICSFREWPRIFPAQNAPRYHVRTARLNAKAEQSEPILKLCVERIDTIIDHRLDRKGIIHTVSYKRQQYLLEHSRHRHLFHWNSNSPESESAAKVYSKFCKAAAPALLVSPSFSTGWDFPGDLCSYQILCKMPFPAPSKIMTARLKRIPNYVNLQVMQELIQACGRGVRSMTDRCESILLDDNILWFMQQNKRLAPDWFHFITTNEIPSPMKLP